MPVYASVKHWTNFQCVVVDSYALSCRLLAIVSGTQCGVKCKRITYFICASCVAERLVKVVA